MRIVASLLAFLLAVPSFGWAANAYVQAKGVTAFGPGTALANTAFTSSVTGTNTIGCAVFWNDQTNSLTSVTDTQSNTYTLLQNPTATVAGRFALAYASNVTGGASFVVTANFSGSVGSWASIVCEEMSGSSGLDPGIHAAQAQTAPGTGTDAITAGTITPSANGAYIMAFVVEDRPNQHGGVYNAGTDFTAGASSTNEFLSEHYVQPTAAAHACSFTNSGVNGNVVSGCMAFLESGGGGGGSTTHRLLLLGVGQ